MQWPPDLPELSMQRSAVEPLFHVDRPSPILQYEAILFTNVEITEIQEM